MTIEKPRVSVIISSYNRASLLRECMESILASRYKDFELLVVDDGSSDNTKEIVAKFADDRIKYFYKENGGSASARNLGIKNALGRYITFIDDDDLWTEDRLDHVALLEENPEIDIVCCDNIFIDAEGNVDPKSLLSKRKTYKGNVLKPMFLCKLSPCLVSMMILKKECFDRAGVFDESMGYAIDTDIERRLSLYCSFLILGDKFYKVRNHDGPRLTDRSFDVMVSEFVSIIDKFKKGGNHSVSLWLLKRSYSRVYLLAGVKCARELGDIDRAMGYFKKAILYDPFNFKVYRYYFSKKRCKALFERAQSRLSAK